MEIIINFITSYWRTILAISSIIGILKVITNSYALYKISNNEIQHINKDIKELKSNEKEYKVDLNKKLDKIFRRLGKIDKAIVKRESICNERHKNDR